MRERFSICKQHLEERNYQEVLAAATELIRDAQSPEELVVAADAAHLILRPGLARRLLRRALSMSPEHPLVVLEVATDQLSRTRFLEAEELLKPRLQGADWPDDAKAEGYALLTASYAGRRRFRSAEEATRRGEELLKPTYARAITMLAHARLLIDYQADRWEAVETVLLARHEAGEAAPQDYWLLSACREHLGFPLKAMEALGEGCGRYPAYPRLWLALAGAAWTLDRLDLAHAALESFAKLIQDRKAARAVRQLHKWFARPATRLKVPPLKQAYNHCFPACLAMIMGYWGRPADHREVGQAVMDGERGTPLFKALRYLEEQGWACRSFRATPDRLRALVDRGVPAIIGWEHASGAHVHICIGYDEEHLLIQDPMSIHRARLRLADFEKVYAHSDYWALTFAPAASAEALEVLPEEEDRVIRLMQRCWESLVSEELEPARRFFAELEQEVESTGFHRMRVRVWPQLGSREQALASVDLLLAAFPEHREVRAELARHLARLDEVERAAALARTGRGHLPVSSLLLLGRVALTTSLDEAAAYFRKAAMAEPTNAEPVAEWGRTLLRAGDLPKAEELFQAAMEMEPGPVHAADLAELQRQQGRCAEAIAAFRQVLRQQRRYPWAWWRLAEAHWELGRLRAAARCLRVAIHQEPESDLYLGRLADLFRAMGQPYRAYKLLMDSPCLATSAELQVSLCAAALSRRCWEETLVLARRGMDQFNDDVRFAPMAAEALRQSGQPAEGIALLQQYADRFPDAPYLHARLGQALLEAGRTEEGIAAVHKAVTLSPEWPEPLDWAAAAAMDHSDPRPVIRLLEEHQERSPGVRWLLARLWQRMGSQGALAVGREALAAEQRSPGALVAFGYLAMDLGEPQAAAAAFEEALPTAEKARAAHGLALLAQRAGRPKAYRKRLAEAVWAAKDPLERQGYADQRAEALEELGWDQVLRFLERLQGHVPEPWRLTYVGYCYEMTGQYEKALELYRSALRRNPEEAWAQYRLPQALLGLERSEEALGAALGYLELAPANSGLHWVRGRCLEVLARKEEAVAAYRLAVQIDPASLPSRHALWALHQEDWPALQAQVADLRPADRVELYCWFGDAWKGEEQNDLALAAWEAAQEANPQHLRSLFRMAESDVAAERPDRAWERYYPRLMKEPWSVLGGIEWLTQQGEGVSHLPWLKRAAKEMDDSLAFWRADVHWLLAECFERSGKDPEAKWAWKQTIVDRPGHRGAVFKLTWNYWLENKYEQMLQLLVPLDEQGTLPADLPYVILAYIDVAIQVGRPQRPHWRHLVLERIRLIQEHGTENPQEFRDLIQLYERLELGLGNIRAAWFAGAVADWGLNWPRVGLLWLRHRLEGPQLDVRPGESTMPVLRRPMDPEAEWPSGLAEWFARRKITASGVVLLLAAWWIQQGSTRFDELFLLLPILVALLIIVGKPKWRNT